MILSGHAQDEMRRAGITEENIEHCLMSGVLEIKQIVKGEMRYGKKLELKDKTIMVIYTFQNKEERVITAYPVRRKKSWLRR